MSEPLPAPAASNTFERIKRVNQAGAECWSSRDFARILGYTDYRNFEAVIEKARTACLNSGQRVEDHFVEITEMIGIGKGGQRAVKTVLVSRYAGYLVIQKPTPRRPSSRWVRPISPPRHAGRNWPTTGHCKRIRSGCCFAPK